MHLRLVLFTVLAWFGLGLARARAEPPVWLVKGPHASVVLFGSVHLLPADLNWEPPTLAQALVHADEVWFEIPIDGASDLAAQRASLTDGLQPQGRRLADDLTLHDQDRLAKAASACGLHLDELELLKPWLADVTLSVASYRLAGADLNDGVERRLAAETPPTAQRRAFETPAEQIAILADTPIADQVASLRETFDEVEGGPALYKRLLQAWLDGDEAAIEREALRPMRLEAPGVYRALVTARNQRWVEVLSKRLDGQGQAVVVVGVGHLIGSDGLPALLERRGFEVTRIDPRSGAPLH